MASLEPLPMTSPGRPRRPGLPAGGAAESASWRAAARPMAARWDRLGIRSPDLAAFQCPSGIDATTRAGVEKDMYSDQLNVSAYIILQDGCPLSFTVLGSGQVEVTCGEPRDGCQLLLDAESLRRFLALGRAAMERMDGLFAEQDIDGVVGVGRV
ncbi:hypothetical protein [Actinophytocola sp.]|uniref:hypothetical protein n=1 Tax=Actinophytocola sp. TaxID=1872138 RepID=UPI003D6C2389